MKQQKTQKIDKLSTSHKFAKNSIYNVIGFIVSFPILILLTPYMLKMLGKTQFGIWAIAGVVTSYAQLSDMGMTTAIVKFVAEHWAKKEVEKISEIVSTAFFSFALVGGIISGMLMIFREAIVINLLKVPVDMQAEAIFVITGVVIIFYLNLLFSVYNSILLGLQRLDLTNIIITLSKILRALGMWMVLAFGMGLRGLIWNSAIISAITIIANSIMIKKVFPEFKIQFLKFSWRTLKIIASYSANILFAKIISLGQEPINKIILSRYVGLTYVAFYNIGERITQVFRQLFQLALAPLLPAVAELHGMNNRDEILKMYLSLSRILYWIAVPVSVLIISLAEPIVFVWLGNGYVLAARAIQLMTIGFLFSLLITPQYVILQGIGKPQINSSNHFLTASINTILGIFLTIKIGYYGVLIAIVISYIIASFHLDSALRNILDIKIRDYLAQIPALFVLFTLLLGFGIQLLIKKYFVHWNLVILLLIVLSALLIIILLYLLTRNASDKILLSRVVSLGRDFLNAWSTNKS